MDKDITTKVNFGRNDDECLPITKCVCGKKFTYWGLVIGMEKNSPRECPYCKRKMYFTLDIKVFEKEE